MRRLDDAYENAFPRVSYLERVGVDPEDRHMMIDWLIEVFKCSLNFVA